MPTPERRSNPAAHPDVRGVRIAKWLVAAASAASLLAGVAPTADAQHLEVSVFGGYAWGGSTELANGSGSFDSGLIYGGSAYWRVRPDGLFGVIYSREQSQYKATFNPSTGGAPVTTYTDVIVGVIHAGGELEVKPNKRLTPTLGLSLGTTYIQPTAGGDMNWYFSTALTGGGKFRITDHIGLRAQIRFLVSVIGGDSAVACVSRGATLCAVSADVNALFMGDLVGGVYVEF